MGFKLSIKCECCSTMTDVTTDKIEMTRLHEYIGTAGQSFEGFVCRECKQKIDNAAFAEYKRIKLNQ